MQKQIHKKYKAFKKMKFSFKNREEELRSLYDFIGDPEVDRYALKFYINEKYPTGKVEEETRGNLPQTKL